jgi:hypothetical protein
MKKVVSAVYFDSVSEKFYLKRFQISSSNNLNKRVGFIGDESDNYLVSVSLDYLPQLKLLFDSKANGKDIQAEIVNAAEFVSIKSYKAKGKRISNYVVKKFDFIEPLPYEESNAEDVDSGQETEELPEEKTSVEKVEEVPVKKEEKPNSKKKSVEETGTTALLLNEDDFEITNPDQVKIVTNNPPKNKKTKKSSKPDKDKDDESDLQMELF